MELDEATQRAAEQLGRPVLVFDTALNVLEFSVHEEQIDRARMQIILHRRASSQAAKMIAESRAENSRDPVVLPRYEDASARILMPLRHAGRLHGYLSFTQAGVVDEHTLQDYAERLAEVSADLGALLAVRQIETEQNALYRRKLLAGLLDADADVRARSGETLVAEGFLAREPRYSVTVVRHARTEETDSSRSDLDHERVLRAAVRSSSFQAFGALDGPLGVAVFPGRVDAERVDEAVRREGGGLVIAGIGGTRSDLTELVDSFHEAKIACEAVERSRESDRVSADWAELGLDRILLQLPLDALRVDDLPDGVTRLMRAHSGIDLAHTLDCYLDCGGEAQETAQRLHIHRSTLYYRLDKIRELTGANLSDGVARREMHTGLRIAWLAGLWRR